MPRKRQRSKKLAKGKKRLSMGSAAAHPAFQLPAKAMAVPPAGKPVVVFPPAGNEIVDLAREGYGLVKSAQKFAPPIAAGLGALGIGTGSVASAAGAVGSGFSAAASAIAPIAIPVGVAGIFGYNLLAAMGVVGKSSAQMLAEARAYADTSLFDAGMRGETIREVEDTPIRRVR